MRLPECPENSFIAANNSTISTEAIDTLVRLRRIRERNIYNVLKAKTLTCNDRYLSEPFSIQSSAFARSRFAPLPLTRESDLSRISFRVLQKMTENNTYTHTQRHYTTLY